jgi:hypothetical protein
MKIEASTTKKARSEANPASTLFQD